MKIDFVKNKKISFIIVAVVFVVGMASFIIRGFNIDIDFVGGTEIIIDIGSDFNEDDVRAVVENVTSDNIVSSIRKSGNSGDEVVIQTKEIDSEMRSKVVEVVCEKYSLNPETALLSVDNVGASVGSKLLRDAILASVLAVVLMLVYISFRFALLSGVAAVVCLCHDVFVMMTVYSLFDIPMGTTVIAAILTILGYSINATIIVFDRVRTNKRSIGEKTFDDVVNLSVNQTLKRSLYTTITTLFTIGMVYLLGVDSIKQFAFPLIVGICAGLFSSVFLAGPVWAMLQNKFGNNKLKK